MEQVSSNEQGISSSEQAIRWVKPDLGYEWGEIERVATLLAENTETRGECIEKIREAVRAAEPEPLPDEVWHVLENTDSATQALTMDEARRLAEEAGRDSARMDEIYSSGEVESPIILIKSDGTAHLVSGNTRLMWARARGIRPFVIMVRL